MQAVQMDYGIKKYIFCYLSKNCFLSLNFALANKTRHYGYYE